MSSNVSSFVHREELEKLNRGQSAAEVAITRVHRDQHHTGVKDNRALNPGCSA